MPARKPKPPAHLSADTGAWWVQVHLDYQLEPHHTRLLTLACEAFDRAAQARDLVAAEGLVVATSDEGRKPHPAVNIERDARLAFARLVRELDLDVDGPAQEARPPALRSNRRL